jgi:hypothetical protein
VAAVDVVDETFLAVPPDVVAAVFKQPESWRRHWPDLRLDLYADRGAEGCRWAVTGALTGTMEIWLEAVLDGTVLHYFLRAETPLTGRQARKVAGARQLAAKTLALELKQVLEDGRPPGVPPSGA